MTKTNIKDNNQKLRLLEQFINQIEPEVEKGSPEIPNTNQDEGYTHTPEWVDRSYSSKHSMGIPFHQQ